MRTSRKSIAPNVMAVILFVFTAMSLVLGSGGSAYSLCSPSEAIKTATTNSVISIKSVNLLAGNSYEFETLALSAGGDTVMRLMKADNSSTFVQSINEIFVDDDGGAAALSSKISFSPGPTEEGSYFLLVHSYSASSAGSANLAFRKNGLTLLTWLHVPFGGVQLTTCSVSNGDSVHLAYEPGEANFHELLTTSGSSAAPARAFRADQIGKQAVSYEHQSGNNQSNRYIVGSLTGPGNLTLMRNDRTTDTDGDGLGNDLEVALKSCPNELPSTYTNTGWSCDDYDSSDTDDDGLSDYDEVFWYKKQALRYWGASPIHKDVFIEVDHDASFNPNPNPLRAEFASNVPAGTPSWADKVHEVYVEGTKTELANPDNTNGLRLHIDLEANGNPDLSYSDNPAFTFDGGGSGMTSGSQPCDQGGYPDRYLDSMQTDRRTFFRYHCLTNNNRRGGGQAAGLATGSGNSWTAFAHEQGHLVDLQHGGADTVNTKPNYVSLMNYALSNLPASIRRLGNVETRFSKGEFLSLNAATLCETDPFGNQEDLSYLENTSWHFDVEPGGINVDWNLDGTISSCAGGTTRGPVTSTSSDQGATMFGREMLYRPDSTEEPKVSVIPTGTPGITRITTDGVPRLYMFYPSSGQAVRYRHMDFPGTCVSSSTSNCGEWSQEYSMPWAAETLSVERFTENDGVTRVYVAVRYGNGLQYVFRGSTNVGTGQLTFQFLKGLYAGGNPELVAGPNDLWVSWRDSSGLLWYNKMAKNGSWLSSNRPVEVQAGSQWDSGVDPALAVHPNGVVYLLRTDANDHLEFLYYNGISGHWLPSIGYSFLPAYNNDYMTTTKPSFAWTKFNLGQDAGYWTIVFPRIDVTAPIEPWLDVLRFGSGVERFGMFSNKWFMPMAGTGMDLLYVPEDDNLHGACIWNTGNPATSPRLEFTPYADGMPDFELTGANDFELMRRGVCQRLKAGVGDDRPCGPLADGGGGGQPGAEPEITCCDAEWCEW